MKSITEYINETMLNEAKSKKTTLGEFVAWFYGYDHFEEVDPMDDLEEMDMDPDATEKYFKGNIGATYEFMLDHKDVDITVVQQNPKKFGNKYSKDVVSVATFSIDKVEFNVPLEMEYK